MINEPHLLLSSSGLLQLNFQPFDFIASRVSPLIAARVFVIDRAQKGRQTAR